MGKHCFTICGMEKNAPLQKLTEGSSLRDVLTFFSSKRALADELGISRQAITNMNMDAPLSRTNYLELRHEKRPDLYETEEVDAA